MNIVELYECTPVQKHGNIKVCGDRVLVKDSQGSVEEYLLGDNGEQWLISSDREKVTVKYFSSYQELAD